ncbi:unnamed protein product [Vitrella brassicaformis CCMP3155]|uniref:Uncharacterized protein n=1 Tax=Vitrella brassicaformis (strain CCMP3155) TaxID=1169540 RepID=A0A0G4GEI4_VITBC|nr:unnamed protein product [Vitrella brassicaformis CCMP3155]|eukprot:CEM27566.1 unnamed protein product [Vitrella brassicaformis CCMP3155]
MRRYNAVGDFLYLNLRLAYPVRRLLALMTSIKVTDFTVKLLHPVKFHCVPSVQMNNQGEGKWYITVSLPIMDVAPSAGVQPSVKELRPASLSVKYLNS